jgi:hypothetical protein
MSRSISTRLLCAAAVLCVASALRAETIYIDYAVPLGNGPPSSAFGAAYGVAGYWNALSFTETNAPVLDTSSAPTGVTVTNNAGIQVANHPSTSGDVELLLDDGLDSSTGFSITVSGLAGGTYDVYTYAWHPASAGDQTTTEITVNAGTPQFVQRSGGFSGFLLSVTHALHNVSISSGQDIVISATTAGQIPAAIVNGLQIVPVPEPSSLALCGAGIAAVAMARWRRRRFGR